MIEVPEVVVNKARAHGVLAWVDELLGLVDELADRWELTPGEVYDGGTEALVVAVECADGSPAVLKLLVPGRESVAAGEVHALRLDGGRACSALLRADVQRGALLLERLGPSMNDLSIPIEQRHPALCRAAQRMWRTVPSDGLMSGADKGAWLIDFVDTRWTRLDQPCSTAVVDHARHCARRRIAAHRDTRSVLVHGDVHEWNALRTLEGDDGLGWKLIDPDGVFAEPEYDLGVMMREDPVELLDGDPRDRARRFAEWTDTDADAIWEWGVVERVATGLLAVEIDVQPVGDQMLAAAEAVVDA
ncbi:MAG: aminoglycoside phosphotransferase family protein [Actinomycetota bacterium]